MRGALDENSALRPKLPARPQLAGKNRADRSRRPLGFGTASSKASTLTLFACDLDADAALRPR
jgi:hypothetical protein